MKQPPSSVLLFKAAQKRGYKPIWLTDYGFFQFTVDGRVLLACQSRSFGNSQLCTWVTADKHATHVLLDHYHFPTIPFCFSRERRIINTFFDRYHPVIAKPVLGEKSEGVRLISDRDKLFDNDLSSTLFESFIKGVEYRYLRMEGKLIAVQKKVLAPTAKYPWKKEYTNLEIGEYDARLSQLSEKINNIIPQQLLAVDFIVGENNYVWVLEVNSMPGLWSFLHPDFGTSIDVTDPMLNLIIRSQGGKI